MEPLLADDPRTVLIALDNSCGDDIAFDWALKNYLKPTDNVQLIHVRSPLDEGMCWDMPPDAISKVELEADVACQQIIYLYLKRCAEAQINCGWKIAVKDEQEAIRQEVLRVCADVLIISSRGSSIVKRKLVGSVSEFCAQNCACPVIIVKAPTKELARADRSAGAFLCSDRMMLGS